MPLSSPQDEAPIRPPHPLALRAIERLRERLPGRVRVLDVASGTGRNSAALEQAGFDVVAVDDESAMRVSAMRSLHGAFAGAVSTHGFLHGTAAEIAERLDALAAHLEPDAVLAATFGSTADERFGKGIEIDPSTYAPGEGDERGIPHAFFSQSQLSALLEPEYEIEWSEERGVDEIAGKWAHRQAPLSGAVHWFVIARRR
jgi:SAM-dependent methyltransferase